MSKKIMFQGTGSSVGKSLLVAAVCRILNDDGHKVAPFKSQNMSLNSFITDDGKEMGRAQVFQAEASRIKPMVEMNPILLKPTSDKGSQVIVYGSVFENMEAIKYFSSKEILIPYVQRAFRTLEDAFDTIVIEGAGSPAEINLRSRDIVNMGLAELVDTDVILIGDVDKGGVFASLYGTFLLLSESEKARVKGFVINKFRGDVSLLMPGVDMLEKLIDRKCLGVIPFMEQLIIDDEDSVSERIKVRSNGSSLEQKVKIGVIKLPYMSNFTDFTVFEIEPDVLLSYVDQYDDLEDYSMLIIPGSKNTLYDMKYIKDSNLDKAIYRAHKRGVLIMGICGGYQMLGRSIYDPHEMESSLKSIDGLGLLDVETTMENEKTTTQTRGEIIASPFEMTHRDVVGYEIHMGVTKAVGENVSAFMRIKSNDGNEMHEDGAINNQKNVMGTYLHGIFDNDIFRTALIRALKEQKHNNEHLESNTIVSYESEKEKSYQRLAEVVRAHMDMPLLYDILNDSRE